MLDWRGVGWREWVRTVPVWYPGTNICFSYRIATSYQHWTMWSSFTKGVLKGCSWIRCEAFFPGFLAQTCIDLKWFLSQSSNLTFGRGVQNRASRLPWNKTSGHNVGRLTSGLKSWNSCKRGKSRHGIPTSTNPGNSVKLYVCGSCFVAASYPAKFSAVRS